MSTPTNDGGPAFPCDSETVRPTQEGMSLRDWFAGMALNGELSAESEQWCVRGKDRPTTLAANAYAIADAMIAARNAK